MSGIDCLTPDWPAPDVVRAASTTRQGGHSTGCWAGLNLATHVQDDSEKVRSNRALLRQSLGLPSEPRWLEQVHGIGVCDSGVGTGECAADAAFSRSPGEVCVVMTADCLPVLLCDTDGSAVAAAHAGWRGLADGILETTVRKFADPEKVVAWLGPAIGPGAFEVGDEVRERFVARQSRAAGAFVANRPGHWLADIYQLARLRLAAAGVRQVFGGGLCTYSDADRFFSYRRDGVTGRMASLIWIRP